MTIGHTISPAVGGGDSVFHAEKSHETTSAWCIFRNLITARTSFGISSQTLGTLRALISFLRPPQGTIIFASNRSLAERSDGLSERSVRRHLAELIAAGLLSRKSSANGKRFRVQNPDGDDDSYGLDLSPFFLRANEIESHAKEAGREAMRVKLHRKRLSSLIFQAEEQLTEHDLGEYRRALRRKNTSAYFASLCEELSQHINRAQDTEICGTSVIELGHETTNMASSDSQFDRHKIKSSKEDYDSDRPEQATETTARLVTDGNLLRSIKKAYPDAFAWASEPITTLQGVEALAWTLATWCGVDTFTRQRAYSMVGALKFICASLHVAQAGEKIRRPAAYFAALTIGNRQHSFNPISELSSAHA